jgi:hypothetical protein
MRKLIFGLLLSVLAIPALAQNVANFAYEYDVDSATLTYCRLAGRNNNPFEGPIPGRGQAETTGSDTAINGLRDADDSFTFIEVGDVLQFIPVGASSPELRVVTAVTDVDNITVNSAVDLTGGVTWAYWDLQCGTSLSDGWIDVRYGTTSNQHTGWGIGVQYNAGDLTGGLAMRVECVDGSLNTQPVIVYPGEGDGCGIGGTLGGNQCEFATPGIDARITVVNDFNVYTSCRVGLAAVTSDTDGTVETVNVSVVTR